MKLWLTNFSIRFPRLILLLTLIVTVLFASQFPKVKFDNDPQNMLSADEARYDMYAGTTDLGVYRTPGGQGLWVPTAPYGSNIPMLQTLIANRSVIATGFGGLAASLNAGLEWIPARGGMNHSQRVVSQVVYSPEDQRYYAAVREGRDPDDLGIWVSADAVNWQKEFANTEAMNAILADFTLTLAMGDFTGYIKRSRGNWQPITDPDILSTQVLFLERIADGSYYALTAGSGLLTSPPSDGENWDPVGGSISDKTMLAFKETTIFTSQTSSKPVLLAGTDGAGIYYQLDDQSPWVQATGPITNASISTIDQLDSVFYAGAGGDRVDLRDAQR